MRRVQLLAACGLDVIASVVVPSAASAVTRIVCASGCSYDRPQQAVNIAQDGDVISIADGCVPQTQPDVALHRVGQLLTQLATLQHQQTAALDADRQRLAFLQGALADLIQAAAQNDAQAAALSGQIQVIQAAIATGLTQLVQLAGLQNAGQATIDQVSGPLKGATKRPTLAVTAAAASLTRAQAWRELVALEAQLRAVVTPIGAPPKRAAVRVRRQGATPLLTIGCPTQACRVTARRRVTVGGHHTTLPAQSLTASARARTLTLRLPRPLQRALVHRRRGTLRLTLTAGGATATTAFALEPAARRPAS